MEEVIDHERRHRASKAQNIARNIELIMNKYGKKKQETESKTGSARKRDLKGLSKSGNKKKTRNKKRGNGWWKGKVRLEDSVFVETDSEGEGRMRTYTTKNSEMDSFVKNETNIRINMENNPFVKPTPEGSRYYKPGKVVLENFGILKRRFCFLIE